MGSGSTSRLDLEFPIGTDPAAIPTDVQGLADGLDGLISPWVQSSSAPVSPIAGQQWWNPVATAATFGYNYYDGVSWWNLKGAYIGSSAPASSACYKGLLWVNTSFTCTQFQVCTAGGGSPTWLILIPGSNTTGQVLINTGSGIAWGTASGGPTTNIVLTSPIETAYLNSTAPTGTVNIYVTTNGTTILCTTNASGNFVFNVAATTGIALNTLLGTGQEITIAVKVKQGSTPYYCTGIDIDGVSQTVNWQGGAAPSAGNASGYDVYTINITKTASATYTVLASLTQF